MQEWIDAVRAELGIPDAIDASAILDVARVAAHAAERPAAPVTTYLLGMAIARGADPTEAVASLTALADRWPTPE